jgi:hypothetical protein
MLPAMIDLGRAVDTIRAMERRRIQIRTDSPAQAP